MNNNHNHSHDQLFLAPEVDTIRKTPQKLQFAFAPITRTFRVDRSKRKCTVLFEILSMQPANLLTGKRACARITNVFSIARNEMCTTLAGNDTFFVSERVRTRALNSYDYCPRRAPNIYKHI